MALTAKLGTVDSTLIGGTLSYGVSTTASFEAKERTASTSITFSDADLTGKTLNKTGSSSITFSQVAHEASVRRTGENSIEFTQAAASGLLTRTAGTAFQFDTSPAFTTEFEVTATTAISFTQAAAPGLLTRTGGNAIEFTQRAKASFITINAIVLSASHSITFSQSGSRSIVFADAVQLDGSTTITFAQSAIFPIELDASTSITFSQLATASRTSAETTITFSQSAVVNRDWSVTASTEITFGQSFIYEHFRNGVPFDTITKIYSPLVGTGAAGNPTPPRLVPVGLTRKTDVLFFYPGTTPQAQATSTVTLRTPNFGDRDRQGYNIINRESRGGTLQIFRDDTWPGQRVLVMDFSNLKETEAESLLTFLATTVGKKVGLRDWQSRTWRGIILNPDTPIIRTREDRIDVSIELEVDDVLLEMSASTEIEFSMSDSTVVETP